MEINGQVALSHLVWEQAFVGGLGWGPLTLFTEFTDQGAEG